MSIRLINRVNCSLLILIPLINLQTNNIIIFIKAMTNMLEKNKYTPLVIMTYIIPRVLQ